MAFSKGRSNITKEEVLSKISEEEILRIYTGIKDIPCLICSPLRKDTSPSFGIYKRYNGIRFYDFSTKEHGSVFDLLGLLWRCSYEEVLVKIYKETARQGFSIKRGTKHRKNESTVLKCKTRDWQKYDLEYWESYGINLKALRFGNVFPISHKIFIKNGQTYIFGADKYAYAFIINNNDEVQMKIYQPFNKQGFKWCSKLGKDAIFLFNKIPQQGEKIVICSSLKDALCLWANTGIPAIAPQGEGYNLPQEIIKALFIRFRMIYVLFDNDEAGLINGQRLSQEAGFTNIVLPAFEGGKDISDYYKVFGKETFVNTINTLLNTSKT